MLFNSAAFLFLFLPVTLTGFILLSRWPRAAMGWLLICSTGFYAYWDVRFLPVLLVSLTANYLLAGAIVNAAETNRRRWLIFGVSLNLLALMYFKYSNFGVRVLAEATGWQPEWVEVVLPIGISFITFQKIAWLVDSYQDRSISRDPLRFGLFVTFFPQLIAGPIVHHKEIIPQLGQARPDRGADFAAGLVLLVLGLFKKVVLADSAAPYSTAMFDQAAAGVAPSVLDAWQGVLAYTLQIYLDFSAYSDMAVGLGRMFGVDLPINFASPYKARSIIDFWRRWHITLSRFLRDYLYIPLGGNRHGPVRQQLNLVITMLLGGFWHGANWTFLLWGFMHGMFLLANHAWAGTALARRLSTSRVWGACALLITLLCVMMAWVPFRADGLASTLLVWKSLLGIDATPTASGHLMQPGALLVLLILMAGCVLLPNTYEIMRPAAMGTASAGYPATRITDACGWLGHALRFQMNLRWALAAAAMLLVVILQINDVSEFIYFQF